MTLCHWLSSICEANIVQLEEPSLNRKLTPPILEENILNPELISNPELFEMPISEFWIPRNPEL